MVETRIAPRYRVMKAAKIAFIGGPIDCKVRDISTTGAALEVSSQIGMRALNRNVERVFNPDRKDHHWGKRKLRREE
jgi:hypothetical protein